MEILGKIRNIDIINGRKYVVQCGDLVYHGFASKVDAWTLTLKTVLKYNLRVCSVVGLAQSPKSHHDSVILRLSTITNLSEEAPFLQKR